MAGQAGAVAAGALDPYQAHRPEPAQPAQQVRIPGRGDGEFPDAEQPADRIQGGRDMGISVGVHSAGNSGCLYHGHCHLFSLVEEVARTRWPSDPVNPGLLSRPGRSDRHAGGRRKTWDPGRQIDRRTALDGVSRIGGQTGTQAPDPTPEPPQNRGGRAGSTYPHPPCRIWISIELVGIHTAECADYLLGADHTADLLVRSLPFTMSISGVCRPVDGRGGQRLCRRGSPRRLRRAWWARPCTISGWTSLARCRACRRVMRWSGEGELEDGGPAGARRGAGSWPGASVRSCWRRAGGRVPPGLCCWQDR